MLHVGDTGQLLQTRRSASSISVPFKTTYANFSSAPSINQALGAGSVDVALAGDNAEIFGTLQHNDTAIVAVVQRPRNFSQLLLAPGVKLDSLADLRGKRIACNPGSISQLFVLRALAAAGVKTSDVTLVSIPGSGTSYFDAVRRGDVDVSPSNEPFTAMLAGKGGVKLVPTSWTDRFNSGLEFLIASRTSLSDPSKAAAIAAYVSAYVRQIKWENTHPDQWAKAYYEHVTHLSPTDAKAQAHGDVPYLFPHLDDRLIAEQQRSIDLLYDAHAIPTRLRAADMFDMRFALVVDAAVRKAGGRFATDLS